MKNYSDVLYDGLRNWIITHFVIYLWSCFQVFATDAIQECSPMCKIQVLLITVSVNIGNVILIQNISFLFPVRQRQTNLILSRPHNFFMTIWFIIPPTRKQNVGYKILFSFCLFVRWSLLRITYSSYTTEQNFLKFSGISCYMMFYSTFYFTFWSEWFFGFLEHNMELQSHHRYYQTAIRYFS